MKKAVFIDFEFHPEGAVTGNPVDPLCLVVYDPAKQQTKHYWKDELRALSSPPFDIDDEHMVVAYNAAAEMECFMSLGWEQPRHVLDLYAEFRCATNGLHLPHGNGLIGALLYFGESAMQAQSKDVMRELVLSAGPWTALERQDILQYCQEDVEALHRLYQRMQTLGLIDLPRALLRGHYAWAAASSQSCGIPLDASLLAQLRQHMPALKAHLTTTVDLQYGVYEGSVFKFSKFEQYLHRQGINEWPKTASGRLALDADTLSDKALQYPQLEPFKQLRKTLSQVHPLQLSVGADGRNRAPLFPFSSLTARNQPKSSAFIFGQPAWIRALIKPQPGMALAYVDFSQQELAIAAVLSGDVVMQQAYSSGDFYLSFAKMAHAVPADATKDSHPKERELFKVCALGVLFGMTDKGLARRLGIDIHQAQQLLKSHQRTFPAFWRWTAQVVDCAQLRKTLHTTFGWKLNHAHKAKTRTVQNFLMQANGSEMMRIAHIELVKNGIRVCAPVHDAFLVEAPIEQIDEVVQRTQAIMGRAAKLILNGFEVRSEALVISYPQRWVQPKGQCLWDAAMEFVEAQEYREAA